MALRRWHALLAALAASTFATAARAEPKTIDVYSVWFAEDLTDQQEIEGFYQCLVGQSSFPAWAAEWDAVVDYHGATVVPTLVPTEMADGQELGDFINDAIGAGYLPAPTGEFNTVYLVHWPRRSAAEMASGEFLCEATSECAEHAAGTLRGTDPLDYEMALVPLACDPCGGTFATATHYGEHEMAEAMADEVGASVEVGDVCDGQHNPALVCSPDGTLQPLENPEGKCERIVSPGDCRLGGDSCSADSECCGAMTCLASQCASCAPSGGACATDRDCCAGTACQAGACASPAAPAASPTGSCELVAGREGDALFALPALLATFAVAGGRRSRRPSSCAGSSPAGHGPRPRPRRRD